MKAFEQPGQAITLMPATTMDANKHKFGVVDANGKLALAGAGVAAAGVIQIPGIVGEPTRVMTNGVSFITIGATLTAGQEVESNAAGLAIPLNTGKSLGICLVGGAANSIGSILLK